MRKPLIISILFHLAILLFAVVTFPTFGDRLPNQPTPLPVDLVTPSELTKIKAGKRDAKKDVAKAEKKPEPPKEKKADKPKPKKTKVKTVKAPEPAPKPKPKPEPVKKAEPAPKPEPKPVKKAEPAPKPEPKPEKKAEPAPKKPEPEAEKKVAEADPLPVPTRKPKPPNVKREELIPEKPKLAAAAARPKEKKKNFDPDKIAALLDKAPDAGPQQVAAAAPRNEPDPAQGRTDGRDLQMTFNEIDALRARISQCWNPPVGGLGADAIQVKLRLQLSEQGSLTTTPQVVNRAGSPFFQAAADAAVRAVMQCQPYQLPPRKYALWRDMILNFDPREMFGG